MEEWEEEEEEEEDPELPFEKVAVLGAGAFGKVFLIQYNDDLAALKYFRRVGDMRDELAALRAIGRHHNISRVLEKGANWFVMKYLEFDLWSLGGLLSRTQMIDLMTDILEALDHIHKAGYRHRDIKPANILVNRISEAKITDFGIAQPGTAFLTFELDMYDLGITFFFMITGRLPDLSGSIPREGIPPDFLPLILALLDRDPEKRPTARQALAMVPEHHEYCYRERILIEPDMHLGKAPHYLEQDLPEDSS
jgi:serine/threonine protein kinase